MKRCPQCNRTYADDTTTFCLEDGGLLSAPYDPGITQLIPPPRATNPPATEILPAPMHHPAPAPPMARTQSKAIYFIGSVMLLGIMVAASIFLIPRLTRPQIVTSPNPVGNWQGDWTSPLGTTYTAKVNLESAGSENNLQGQINWTLKGTNSGPMQAKIGKTGIEYIRGTYDPTKGTLSLEGYREDDPNDIITLDKYELTLGNHGSTLQGSTSNHGGWRGRISLSR